MITLRRVGKQETCRVILSDPLIGVLDGVNQTFSVSYEYTPGRIEILYNGQVLTSPQDFTETGPEEITLVYLYPEEQTILRANYEIGDCTGIEGGGGADNFVELEDTPSSYASQAGKLVSVNNTETGLSFIDFEAGLTNFISLTDTPTTYSGFEDHYVKVTPSGDGLEFVLPEGDIQEGISSSISSGVYSTTVNFDRAFANDQYVLTVGLENTVDPEPSIYPILIRDKSTTGFTVDFSGDIDSDNYYLNWRATLSGTSILGGGGSGINELSNDLSPELGGNLEVGDHLVMLNTAPNGTTVSGGYVRGHSGDASEMFVFDNSPMAGDGFGTPLYMRTDGKWGTCTAVSGTTQMPCAALAIEPGDGTTKNILWKGIIRKGEWSWTPGDLIYVSTVEGAITNVEPNNGHRKQCIGLAIAQDTIRFDPGFNPGF
jgi:hypothetical protein